MGASSRFTASGTEADETGVMMAQRQMSFVHPFSFEFKRLAYDAVKDRADGMRVSA